MYYFSVMCITNFYIQVLYISLLKLSNFFNKFPHQLVVRCRKDNFCSPYMLKKSIFGVNILHKRIWLFFKLILAKVWFIIISFFWNKSLKYFLAILTKIIRSYFIVPWVETKRFSIWKPVKHLSRMQRSLVQK